MPALPPLNVVTKDSFSSSRIYADHEYHQPSSPVAPPYSPITPVMPSNNLYENPAGYQYSPPQDTPQPPPLVPFSESDNTDAIALRAAISILQIQRQQSIRDMETLEQQKKAAVANPEAFAADVGAGKVKTISSNGLVVGSTPEMEHKVCTDDFQDSALDSDSGDERPSQTGSKFGNIPGPQNVVRMPPINWAKYHIVGEALDKLHEEQRARPTPGQPRRDHEPSRAPEHVIAAPYSPWTDRVTEPYMRTRSHAKREH